MKSLLRNRRRLTAMALALALVLFAGLANAAPSSAQAIGQSSLSKKTVVKADNSPEGYQCYRVYFTGGIRDGQSYNFCKPLKPQSPGFNPSYR